MQSLGTFHYIWVHSDVCYQMQTLGTCYQKWISVFWYVTSICTLAQTNYWWAIQNRTEVKRTPRRSNEHLSAQKNIKTLRSPSIAIISMWALPTYLVLMRLIYALSSDYSCRKFVIVVMQYKVRLYIPLLIPDCFLSSFSYSESQLSYDSVHVHYVDHGFILLHFTLIFMFFIL